MGLKAFEGGKETTPAILSGRGSASDIIDLRSAIEFLKRIPGQLLICNEPVDPDAELAGVYRRVGAGTPVEPPTKEGPAMLFERVLGYDIPVITGVLASRKRVAQLLGTEPERVAHCLLEALETPVAPVMAAGSNPPCQEVVHHGNIDIMKLLPAPHQHAVGCGSLFHHGARSGRRPGNRGGGCNHSPSLRSGEGPAFHLFRPGTSYRSVSHQGGKNRESALPVSINIGLDPAIYLAACFEPPTTPLGFDELSIAGGLRKKPVELTPCISVPAKSLARAEIVIEGEILPGERIREDVGSDTGFAMPEFPGYLGPAKESVPVIRVTAVTHRRNPIMQTIVGPGLEHTSLAGIPTEASILRLVETGMPGKLLNVYAHEAGGGKYLAVPQFRKSSEADEGRQRQAALMAFAAFSELKHVILVDEDVDIFDTNDVLWAMTTRYQGDVSTTFIPGVRCHPWIPVRPRNSAPPSGKAVSVAKPFLTAPSPYRLKGKFKRAPFADVDPDRFLKNSFDPAV